MKQFSRSIREALSLFIHILRSPNTYLGSKKHRHALAKKLSTLLVADLSIFLLFFCFYTAQIVHNAKKDYYSSMSTYLETVINMTDQLLALCSSQPTQKIYDDSAIISISFSSDSDPYKGAAIAKAKADLRVRFDNSFLVQDAFLYIPASHMIINSSQSNIGATYSGMITHYLQTSLDEVTVDLSGDLFRFFRYGDSYFLAKDFFPYHGEAQSSLFLLLNTNALRDSIQEQIGDAKNQIYVLDSFGTPLWNTPESPDYLSNLPTSTGSSPVHHEGSYIFSEISTQTQWRFYLVTSKSVFGANTYVLLSTVAPFAVFLLFVTCVISMFTAVYLYRPFHEMLRQLDAMSIPQIPEASASIHDELDYFNVVLSCIINRQNQTNDMLQVVSSDVTLRIFLNLISGLTMKYDDVSEMLENIRSPFQMNALYVAIVLQGIDPCSSNISKSAILLRTISGFLHPLDKKNNTTSFILQSEPGTLVVALQFNETSISIISAKAILLKISPLLLSEMEKADFPCHIACGHMYHSILDFGFSYSEAVKELRKAPESPVTAVKTVDSASVLPDDEERQTQLHISYFKTRIHQLVDQAASSVDQSSATQLLERVIKELQATAFEPMQRLSLYQELLRDCISSILAYPYINPDLFPDVYGSFQAHTSDNCDATELSAHLQESLQLLMNTFISQIQRQQNPHIIATREYIESHYADPNLSLADIAATTNISPNYLARLYKEGLGIGLLDYLMRYRLTVSLSMLQSGKTITEIAVDTGFGSSRNYIRAFKKVYNTTPGIYRKLHQQENHSEYSTKGE